MASWSVTVSGTTPDSIGGAVVVTFDVLKDDVTTYPAQQVSVAASEIDAQGGDVEAAALVSIGRKVAILKAANEAAEANQSAAASMVGETYSFDVDPGSGATHATKVGVEPGGGVHVEGGPA